MYSEYFGLTSYSTVIHSIAIQLINDKIQPVVLTLTKTPFFRYFDELSQTPVCWYLLSLPNLFKEKVEHLSSHLCLDSVLHSVSCFVITELSGCLAALSRMHCMIIQLIFLALAPIISRWTTLHHTYCYLCFEGCFDGLGAEFSNKQARFVLL